MAEHSLSAVQARQVFVALLQMGVAPEQLESSVHWTHAPVAEHTGRFGSSAVHWDGPVQPAQVLVAVLQMGVAPEQLALVRHATQVFVDVSHFGVPPEHVESSVHWTQAPVAAQAGLVASTALHWEGLVHAPQVLVVVLQMGAAPEQLALVTQATQVFVAVSQTGVVPGHVELSMHWTQAPVAEQAARAGSLARHSAELAQTPHTWAGEQMGAAAGHVPLVRHSTHLPAATSQTGAAAEQVELSAHCTHAPVAEQTGRAGSMAAHWAELAQGAQAPAAEHTGACAGQVALVTQPTQVPVGEHIVRAGSARVAQSAELEQVEHTRAAEQMGACAGHVAPVRHWTHLPAVTSQTGVTPEQVGLSTHPTQAPVGEQAGRVGSAPAHCPDVAQAVQVPAEQMGALTGQVALVEQEDATSMGEVSIGVSGVPPSYQRSHPGAPRPSQTHTCLDKSQRRPSLMPTSSRHCRSVVHGMGSRFVGRHATRRTGSRGIALRMT